MKRRQLRQKPKLQPKPKLAKQQPTQLDWDEEIESSVDGDMSDDDRQSSEEEEEDEETAEQKRKRLAKEYLAGMGEEDSGDSDDEDNESDVDDGRDVIGDRLTRERLLARGALYRSIADGMRVVNEEAPVISYHSGHKLSVTAVALCQDNTIAYSGSKDNSVIGWDVETGSKHILLPHWDRKTHGYEKQCSDGEVLSVAVSSDKRYVVSAGKDKEIKVFDVRNKNALVASMKGHRDTVTSLAFRRDTYTLYSGSADRCIKHWELNDMAYLETLFGHQDKVCAVDCWNKDKPLSASTDRSLRLWTVAEDSHTIYRGHKGSIDACQLLTDDSYLSGGEDGCLCLWKDSQKKPIATVKDAHDGLPHEAAAEGQGEGEGRARGGAKASRGASKSAANPNWICSLASVKMSDLVWSGSSDGYIRGWKAVPDSRSLEQVCTMPVGGFVNSLAISTQDPRVLVAALGREHKHGRWWNLGGNKDKVAIIPLPSTL